jgi:hypothetical protein
MKVFRFRDLQEGRWRNGMGVSWDIASEEQGSNTAGFGWRMALARLDANVAFSHYPETDRIFTLVEGKGLELAVENHGVKAIRNRFVPLAFPGDAATTCRLLDGPCMALNLFTARGAWTADVQVMPLDSALAVDPSGPVLLHVLQGVAVCEGHQIGLRDSILTESPISLLPATVDCLLYVACLGRMFPEAVS